MANRNPPQRHGFTLIELLVVVSVIGILIGLLMPAVQKVRDAAARAQCANNLKQIGLALHNYHDALSTFPGNQTTDSLGTVRERWFLKILPYLDQGNLFNRYVESSNYDAGGNLALTSLSLAVAQCPGSPDSARLDGNPDVTGAWATTVGTVAVTDYGAFYGVHNTFLQANNLTIGSPEGMVNSVTGTTLNINSVLDGTSNTIHVVESAGRPELFRLGIRVSSAWQVSGVNGGGWARPASDLWLIGSDRTGTVVGGPVSINACNGFDHHGAWPLTIGTPALGKHGSGQMFSFHAGGANALFVDGSVRFLDQSTSATTMASLVTRAGGEVTH